MKRLIRISPLIFAGVIFIFYLWVHFFILELTVFGKIILLPSAYICIFTIGYFIEIWVNELWRWAWK